MLTKEDLLMHSKATRHLATRVMRYGDKHSADRLMASALALEQFARERHASNQAVLTMHLSI
jgi:ribosomal protein S7